MLSYSQHQLQLNFQELCMLGDVKGVESALLTGRVDINYKHRSSEWTALHWAASREHEDICLLLIEAGFSLNAKDSKGRIPLAVCSQNNQRLRDILQPAEPEEEDDDEDGFNMVKSESTDINNSSEFVPNYIRHPPFPYTTKNMFDNCASSASPSSPTAPATFSYGRRDSLNRTRFLLVRTSSNNRKETYKRVTLPGGSDLEKLKQVIEKACKRKSASMIFTLPDNDLVETTEQIQNFKDCQKIDVVFTDDMDEEQDEVSITSDIELKKHMSGDSEHKEDVRYAEDIEDKQTAEIEVPENKPEAKMNEEPSIEETKETEKTESQHLEEPRAHSPAEDLSSYVKDSSPPLSIGTTDLDTMNIDNAPEAGSNESNGTEGSQEGSKVAKRNSFDSDPGDFEKVYKDDAKNEEVSAAVAGFAANIPIIDAQLKEDQKNAAQIPEEPVPYNSTQVTPSIKAKVVEESKMVPDQEDANDFSALLKNNPCVVRNIATATAVAAVAGVVYYIYVKKYK